MRARGRSLSWLVLCSLTTVVAAAPFRSSGPVIFAMSGIAVFHFSCSGRLRGPGRPLLAFLIWCALSTLWSVAPGLTVRATLIAVTTTLATTFAVAQLSRQDVLGAIGTALKLLIALSWTAYLLVPAVGREQVVYHQGALKGVFVQRNSAAFVLGASVLLLTYAAVTSAPTRRRTEAGWALVAAITLAATESSTGIAVTAAAWILIVTALLLSRISSFERVLALGTSLLGVGALGVLASSNGDLTPASLGRDSTFTGRTVIWEAVLRYVDLEPVHGYGWGALWTEDAFVTRQMWGIAGFEFPHAHNAYLDALAQVGWVGLLLLCAALLVVLVRAVRAVLSPHQDSPGPLMLAMAVFLLLYGLSEVSFLSYFGLQLLVTLTALSRVASHGARRVGGTAFDASRS